MKRFKDFFYENVIIPDISKFIKNLITFGNKYIIKSQSYSNKQLLNLLNDIIKEDNIRFVTGEPQVKIYGGDKVGVSSFNKELDNNIINIEITPYFYENLRDTNKFYNLIKFLEQHIGHEFIHRKQQINNVLSPDDPEYFKQEHEIEAFAYNAANELKYAANKNKNKFKNKQEVISLIKKDMLNKDLLENSYRYSLYVNKFINDKDILNKFIDKVIEYLELLP